MSKINNGSKAVEEKMEGKDMENYILKTQKLLVVMEQKGYSKIFDGNKEEGLDTLKDCFDAFQKYYEIILNNERTILRMKAKYTDEGLNDRMEMYQMKKRMSLDNAKINTKILNHISCAYTGKKYVDIDHEDSRAVEAFIGNYCKDLYEFGIARKDQ